METPDGVYADATYHEDGTGAIGIVLVRNGVVLKRYGERMVFLDSKDAETEAVERAQEMYPGFPVFTDCQYAARVCGAILISRNLNGEAHRTASRAYSSLSLQGGSCPIDHKPKRKTRAEVRKELKENMPPKTDGRNPCSRGLRTGSILRKHAGSTATEGLPIPEELLSMI